MKIEDFESLRIYKPEDLPRWDWLDFNMVKMLDELTVRLGQTKPLKILSLFRTKPENEACGGAPRSMHLLGKAVDFVPPGDPLNALHEAKAVGFTGIGLYLNEKGGVYIHADNRPGQGASWGVLDGVYGGIGPVIERLKTLGVKALDVPVATTGIIVLTALVLLYIFSRS
jgi:hypothetical protein